MHFLSILIILITIQVSLANPTSPDTKDVFNDMKEHLSRAARSAAGRQYGCNDSFSIFGFLAFLLALLDLILELQAAARRKRDLTFVQEVPICQDSSDYQQAAAASYSLLRGFLNALGTTDPECAKRMVCEAGQEAALGGPVGEVIAHVGSLNAASWLMKVNESIFDHTSEAGQAGGTYRDCSIRYSQCYSLPPNYRHPGVFRGTLKNVKLQERIIKEVIGSAAQSILT